MRSTRNWGEARSDYIDVAIYRPKIVKWGEEKYSSILGKIQVSKSTLEPKGEKLAGFLVPSIGEWGRPAGTKTSNKFFEEGSNFNAIYDTDSSKGKLYAMVSWKSTGVTTYRYPGSIYGTPNVSSAMSWPMTSNQMYMPKQNIIKIGSDYWIRIYGQHHDNEKMLMYDLYHSNEAWDWVKVEQKTTDKNKLIHGFAPYKANIRFNASKMDEQQAIQSGNQTNVLISLPISGTNLVQNKIVPKEQNFWGDATWTPWVQSQEQLCISSWLDIDKETPSIEYPVSIPPFNRIFSKNHDKDKLFFVVYPQEKYDYLIYLALSYNSSSDVYKPILGIVRLTFDETGHSSLWVKREFTNKNGDASLPITDCYWPIYFNMNYKGDLWFTYASKSGSTYNYKYVYIDANTMISSVVI